MGLFMSQWGLGKSLCGKKTKQNPEVNQSSITSLPTSTTSKIQRSMLGAKDQSELSLWAQIRVRRQSHIRRGWETVRDQKRGAYICHHYDVQKYIWEQEILPSKNTWYNGLQPHNKAFFRCLPPHTHTYNIHTCLFSHLCICCFLFLRVPSLTFFLANSHLLFRKQLPYQLYCKPIQLCFLWMTYIQFHPQYPGLDQWPCISQRICSVPSNHSTCAFNKSS